jgi:hypothetical protein
LQLDILVLIIRGESLRDWFNIRAIRGRVGLWLKILEVNDSNIGNGSIAAVVLNSKVERDISDGFGLDRDENRRKIGARETDGINRVGVGIGDIGTCDVGTLPVFKRIVSNGESCHSFMLKDKAIVRFFMPLEEDRDFPADVRAIADGIFPVERGGKDGHSSATGRGEKIDMLGAAPQVCRLLDEAIGLDVEGCDEGESQVVEVPEVDGGEVDVHVVRPNWLLEVLGIEGNELGVRGRSKGPRFTRRESSTVGRHSTFQWDETSIRRRRISIRGPVLKNQFLRVLLFFLAVGVSSSGMSHCSGSRNHKAASGTAVVAAEAKVAEERNQSSLPIGAKPIVHGGSRGREKGRLSMGTESSRGRVRRRVRGHLTVALKVAGAPAPTAAAGVAASSDEMILRQATEATPRGFF